MSDAPETPAEFLDHILRLAQTAREAEFSHLWKTDIGAACEAHGDACNALWRALYTELDRRAGVGERVAGMEAAHKAKAARIKRIKKEIAAIIKADLEIRIDDALDQIEL